MLEKGNRMMTTLVYGKKLEQVLVMEGLDGENLAFYNTLHKGDSITINSSFGSDANGSYIIMRKYRCKNRVRFVLEKEG
jgi:hypothetical protein